MQSTDKTLVVAKLVQWLLPTLKIRSLNLVIGKFCIYQLYWKDEHKEKRPGMFHLKNSGGDRRHSVLSKLFVIVLTVYNAAQKVSPIVLPPENLIRKNI